MIKIAMIVNGFPEISQKFILNQVIYLKKSGVELTVIAAQEADKSVRHSEYDEHEIQSITKFLKIPVSLKKRIVKAPKEILQLFFKSPGKCIKAINWKKYGTAARNFKLMFFGNALSDKKFDIVHCQFGQNGLIGTYLKDCGIADRLVVTFHGSDINTYPKRFGLKVYEGLYKEADLITANTRFTANKIIKNGCPEEKIKILPVGIILEEYQGLADSEKEPLSLLTVARMEEKKGHIYALQAVARLVRKYPEMKYYLAGRGELMESLQRKAEDLGIQNICNFLGICSSEQVKNLYKKASVFLLPSVTAKSGDMEGQGLVLQEAQACGIPVVSTRHNGIPDGVMENVSGYLAEEKDVDGLVEAIDRLFQDPENSHAMGMEGHKFVKGKYDMKIITDQLISYYKAII